MCILYCCEGRKLDNYWVITTPSLNKEYCIVLYCTLLSIYQIMLLTISTAQVKKKIRLRKICFQGIQTRTLQSVRTETLLSISIFSKKSIFNEALCRFKYFDRAKAEHPQNTWGRVSAALPHILHATPPGWFLSLRLIPLGHTSAAQFEI